MSMTIDERDRITRLEVHMGAVQATLARVETKVDGIGAQANRWKGAIGIILGLGGVIGFAAGWLKDYFVK